VISDLWDGLETLFSPGEEILLAPTGAQVLEALDADDPASERAIAGAARARVLAEHTAEHRAAELERWLDEARARKRAALLTGSAA
jgi:spore maturation protein CgeB